MQNSATNFLKGVGTGMIAGAAVVVVGKMMLKDHKNATKGGAKLIKAAGDFVDGVQTMFK